MLEHKHPEKGIPCCPDLSNNPTCDTLDFHYRTIHNTTVAVGDRRQTVAVEVLIHARLERCPAGLEVGDLAYSTTLFPGEKVRLFTTDRRTRFTFDASSNLSYRNEQTQEEHFYMSSMDRSMSDLSVRDSGRSKNVSQGSAEAHTETSGLLETIFSGPSVGVSGSHNSTSTSEFLRELHQHAEASHHRSEMGTRASSAVSVGEVNTRSHAQGETEDHFESASREFKNPNRCHAITFYFYRINKAQVIRFTVEAIRRRVIDPAANTQVLLNPQISRGQLAVIPQAVRASDDNRIKLEELARQSAVRQAVGVGGANPSNFEAVAGQRAAFGAFQPAPVAEPLAQAVRERALRQVDQELVKAGLLDQVGGGVSPETRLRFSFERRTSFPTPGLFVRGCLDECSICEPELEEQIKLELEHLRLKNRQLERQIELMDTDQEHRCCPPAPNP